MCRRSIIHLFIYLFSGFSILFELDPVTKPMCVELGAKSIHRIKADDFHVNIVSEREEAAKVAAHQRATIYSGIFAISNIGKLTENVRSFTFAFWLPFYLRFYVCVPITPHLPVWLFPRQTQNYFCNSIKSRPQWACVRVCVWNFGLCD